MWCRDLRLSLPQTDNTPGASRQDGACARSTSRSSASRSSAFAFLGRSPIPWAVSSHLHKYFFRSGACFVPAARLLFVPYQSDRCLATRVSLCLIWLRGRQAEPRSVSGERDV